MEIKLKYGDSFKAIEISEKAEVTVLQPVAVAVLDSIQTELKYSLENPLGCEPLSEQLHRKNPAKIVIAIPDETRPTPVKELLPILLQDVYRALPELDPFAITMIIGGGLHPPPDRETENRILSPDMVPGCNIVVHDAHNSRVTDFGTTNRGTPVRINAAVGEADFKMVIGQIDPHQFVGFTGGSKGITIGCAAAESIEHNHKLMFRENAQVGRLDGNPVREDINEAGRMVGIDFAVNAVLNPDMQAVRLLAGDPEAVLKEGAQTCADVFGVGIGSKFDIVVASCGGYPKDISLYQAQKGLNLASHAVKKGGKILLLGACQQGIGDDIYFDYVCQFATPEEVLQDFKNHNFSMGAHKAYLFGTTLVNYDVAVFSELDSATMGQCHLRAADPSTIIGEWLDGFKGKPKLAVIPYANTTFFYEK